MKKSQLFNSLSYIAAILVTIAAFPFMITYSVGIVLEGGSKAVLNGLSGNPVSKYFNSKYEAAIEAETVVKDVE